MSLTSKSRKESTESYAAQRMHNTMGVPPELGQLYDRQLDNEQLSRRVDSNDVEIQNDVLNEDVEPTAETDEQRSTRMDADADEARRASWGQPAADRETGTWGQSEQTDAPGEEQAFARVPDADWNRSTEEGGIVSPSRQDPDRTVGHS